MRWTVAFVAALFASWFVVADVDDCDGATIWQSASVGIGGQGVWVDEGGVPGFRDMEAIGRAALSVTPHVSLVGGISYGVDRAYVRGSGGVRLTVTDAENPDFGIGVGVSRHYVSEPESGLDEAAAEAAIGWKPFPTSPFIVTGLATYGLDTNRRVFTVGLVWPFKRASGGAQ